MSVLVLHGHNPEDIHIWDDLVDRAPIPDVYYRPGYVRAYALTGHGRPLALVVRCGEVEVLFPLLIRQMEVNGEMVRDAVTPYGYGGLLQISGATDPALEVVQSVLGQLREWARASGLAACTIRFHPLLKQDAGWALSRVPGGWGRSFARGETTAVDLHGWDESRQRISGMNENRRRDLKKARVCLRLSVSHPSHTKEAICEFKSLYRETMERLNADPFFFFTDKYFELLGDELGERCVIISAAGEAGTVGSSIFLAGARFAHYHLSGTNDEGRLMGATTLLMNAGAEWARQQGCSLLHLGGGLQESDQLWEFKRSFGGGRYWYSYATLVVDPDRYEFLRQHGTVWPYVSGAMMSNTLVDRMSSDTVLEAEKQGSQVSGRFRSSKFSSQRSRGTRIAIYGAAGFGREIAPLAREYVSRVIGGGVQHEGVVFVSDIESQIGKFINGIRVVPYEDLLTDEHRDRKVVVALSDTATRRSIVERCEKDGLEFGSVASLSHRSYDDVNIREGAIICDYTVFAPNVDIGRHFHCNMFSYVGHDCRIGDFVTFSPGVSCSGRVAIEDDVFVGAGVLLRPGTEEKHLVIGKGAVLGMGAIVTSDIPAGARIVGMGAVATRLSATRRNPGDKDDRGTGD